jgi:hypothetical protein
MAAYSARIFAAMSMFHMKSALCALTCVLTLSTVAQKSGQRPLVQFSGVVVTGDSLLPVPFVQIATVGSYRGTVSDVFGYFSFVAQVGDTLGFAAVGFKRDYFVVPDSISDTKYSMIHVLHPDTILLNPVMVTPWPSKEQFAEAFLNLRLSEDDYQLAMRRLSSAEMVQQMENMPADPGLSHQVTTNLANTRLYQQGGMPTISLLNPIAWAQFMQAWRSGKFKKQ